MRKNNPGKNWVRLGLIKKIYSFIKRTFVENKNHKSKALLYISIDKDFVVKMLR